MKRKVLLSATIFCIFVVVSLSSCLSVNAQETTSTVHFTLDVPFVIADNNSTIRFASYGSYESASFNNGIWEYVGFALNIPKGYPTRLPGMGNSNFSISAWNCNVTVTCVQDLTGFPSSISWLNYTVSGTGNQSFNMYYPVNNITMIDWAVYIDGKNKTQNDGWTIKSDGWLAVTGATNTVSIHRHQIHAVEMKIREFKAQGMNDTQIVEELEKIGMWWNLETGSTALGTMMTREEMDRLHIPVPGSPATLNPSVAPASIDSPAPSSKPVTAESPVASSFIIAVSTIMFITVVFTAAIVGRAKKM